MKILVVDDNPIMRENMSTLLSCAGYEIDLAVNGLDAFEKAQQQVFALYIIDHLMPVMNGIQLTKNLKSIKNRQNTPVLFMTTQGIESAKSLAEYELFADVVEKPIINEYFLSLVEKLIGQQDEQKSG